MMTLNDQPHSTTLSRRRALAGFASAVAAAATLNSTMAGDTDPAFAAIERHRSMWREFRRHAQLCDQIEQSILAGLRGRGFDGDLDEVAVVEEDPRWQMVQTACDAAAEEADAAAWSLVDNEPTTLLGAAVLLWYAHEVVAKGVAWPDGDSQELGALEDWNSELHRMLAVALLKLSKTA